MKSPHATPAGRAVTGAFGLFFVVLAAVVLARAEGPTLVGSIIGAAVLGALGIEAIFAAVRGRAAWLARIGPLP